MERGELRGWAYSSANSPMCPGVFKCSTEGCEFSAEYRTVPEMIALVDEHYERAHTVRDESAEYLPLTPRDRRWLEGLRISTD